ncbi:group-specific protein [Bacillus tianshenii]|uniref:group-specific protein n=1 Tax=Sutcliffiella tianshenii TaxID=1463404 RepID=UPI001CD7A159|nr:group-specific protein [Bacillus tianshenii]MCA1319578.1 group-specific protein [Bacillus tianshenii]
MKFYVASGFSNIEKVRYVSGKLKSKGHKHTYDWTLNERASTIEDLTTIGLFEKKAVTESDFVIVLLPGGKGTHIELGIALGLNKRIILYSENREIYNFDTTSTFYHLPEVEKFVGTLDELIEFL